MCVPYFPISLASLAVAVYKEIVFHKQCVPLMTLMLENKHVIYKYICAKAIRSLRYAPEIGNYVELRECENAINI